MVSTFRYRSFKDIDLKHRLPFKYLVVGVGLVAIVAIRPEVMLFALFFAHLYALLGAIFGILGWGKPPKERPILTVDGSKGGDDLHEEVDEHGIPHEEYEHDEDAEQEINEALIEEDFGDHLK